MTSKMECLGLVRKSGSRHPKTPLNPPICRQDGRHTAPSWPQDDPKTAPRCPKTVPKRAQGAPKTL